MRDGIDSRTLIGLLIAIAGPYAAKYGIDDAQMQAIAQGLSALVGGVLAVYGRQKATGPITHVAGMELPKALVPQQTPEEPKP